MATVSMVVHLWSNYYLQNIMLSNYYILFNAHTLGEFVSITILQMRNLKLEILPLPGK